MGKLFGTDGIRGKANTYPITPEIALKLGKAIAKVFGAAGKGKRRAIIGKDTRISGYMLETALTSGLTSMGMEVYLVGPMPTPAVAHLSKSMLACAGLMITASHNPAEDNGIKVFDQDGFKLPDEIEEEIEALLLSEEDITPGEGIDLGKAFRIDDAGGRYIEFAKGSVNNMDLSGLKIVLDCANGAGYTLAPRIFRELGVEIIKTGADPDGLNINDGVGALYPEVMAEIVVAEGADCGIALDGDADRVILCDAKGNIVNGDRVLAMSAIAMKKEGELANNTLVVTKMSNLGLHKAMEKHGINTVSTDVGDRYIIENMRKYGFNLGGEQSGHLIFMDHSTTGDGVISALKILKMMKDTGKNMEELSQCMDVFPQKLTNIPVSSKPPLDTLPKITATVSECEKALDGSGRCMLRYSGTENKIRVLVEAEKQSDVDHWTEVFTGVIKEELC